MSSRKSVENINDQFITSMYESKYGFKLGYDFDENNRRYPIVLDTKTDLVYYNDSLKTKSERRCLYEAAGYANYLLLNRGIIDEFQKNKLDEQMYKYYNCQICCN